MVQKVQYFYLAIVNIDLLFKHLLQCSNSLGGYLVFVILGSFSKMTQKFILK